jgi:D-amino-acid dehydrogenase
MGERSVLVIGGGVIGVCSAYYLARDGFAVTLVDKDDVCAGSSHGNAGLIVPSHSIPLAAPGVLWKGLKWMLDPESPFYIKPRPSLELVDWLWRFRGACTAEHVARTIPVLREMHYASLGLFRELAALDGVGGRLEQRGVLSVFTTDRLYEKALHEARMLEGHGLPFKPLDGPAARALEPALTPEVVGAILLPDDAQVIPGDFVRGLARVTEGLGVRIRPATEVLGIETAGGRVRAVETTRGRIEAEQVVLASGAWSPGLAGTMGLSLPIQPAKGYSLTFARPPHGPAYPLLVGESGFAVTPMGDTLRFAGTLELAGMDLSINRRRVAAIARGASRYLRDVENLRPLEIWRGLRPCTPDGLPLIGRSSRAENLILATGHAMMGVSLGPVTGKMVSQLAAGAPPMCDLGLMRAERFG